MVEHQLVYIYCILRRQIKGFNSAIYAIKCQQVVIGASLSEPHTSESPPQILVLSTMHKKLRQKSDNLRVRREFNGVDYSAFLYGLCNRPCYDK